jgi:hypothetical protein
MIANTSVSNPHAFYADPDPVKILNGDPDPTQRKFKGSFIKV